MAKTAGINKIINIDKGLGEAQKYWIYFNQIEDENKRVDEIHQIIKTLNWRLKPETAARIEEQENIEKGKLTQGLSTDHENILDKIFEGK